jgi:hypothetical protein
MNAILPALLAELIKTPAKHFSWILFSKTDEGTA